MHCRYGDEFYNFNANFIATLNFFFKKILAKILMPALGKMKLEF